MDPRSPLASDQSRPRRRWRVPPLYPVALAFAVVALLIVTAGVSPTSAIRATVITLVVAVLLVLLGRLLLGDWHRGAFFATLAILAIAGGQPLVAGLVGIGIVLLLLERYALPEERRTLDWSRISTILRRLVTIMLIAIGILAIQQGTFESIARAATHEGPFRPVNKAPTTPGDPDIYVLLLDGHPRLDIGETYFGIDPRPLRDGLTERGFTISEASRGNYVQTAEVLSSLFEQAHLKDIPRMAGLTSGTESKPAGLIVRDTLNDSATLTYLRARGYDIHAISSGFEEVSIREADRFVDTGQINEFEIGMLLRTIVGDVVEVVAPDAVSAGQRGRIESVFDEIARAPSMAGERPMFLFAHVPSPHAPWVFAADGSARTVADLDAFYAETTASTGLSNDAMRPQYAGQVIDTDRRLLEALDRIDAAIAERGRPAVTVVMSDHGTWIDADDGDIRLRFKNLLAVRASDRRLALDQDLTLVNLFPALFEQLFGEPWVRRADSIYTHGPTSNFDLIEVDESDGSLRP